MSAPPCSRSQSVWGFALTTTFAFISSYFQILSWKSAIRSAILHFRADLTFEHSVVIIGFLQSRGNHRRRIQTGTLTSLARLRWKVPILLIGGEVVEIALQLLSFLDFRGLLTLTWGEQTLTHLFLNSMFKFIISLLVILARPDLSPVLAKEASVAWTKKNHSYSTTSLTMQSY